VFLSALIGLGAAIATLLAEGIQETWGAPEWKWKDIEHAE
jgi:hypothetical protein